MKLGIGTNGDSAQPPVCHDSLAGGFYIASRSAAGLIVALLAAVLFAACGSPSGDASALSSSSGAPSPSVSASPTAGPQPVATYGRGELVPKEAVLAVKRYFAAVTVGDAAAAKALLTPDSRWRSEPLMGFNSVTHVRVDTRLRFPPPKHYSAEPGVTAYIDAVEPSGWGPPGDKHFYVTLREAPAGTWLISRLSAGR